MSDDPVQNGRVALKKKRGKLASFFWGFILMLAILGIVYWLFIGRFIEYTDDAYVQGNQIRITSLKPGFITAIHTDDTYLVKKGQLLIELDTTDAIIALEFSKKELAKVVREVCQAFHEVFALRSEIEVKKAELIRTAQDYHHRAGVIAAEGVSLEDFQHAIAALRASYFSLKATESFYRQSLAFVQGTAIKSHPLVQSAADLLRDKWVQLYRCKIYSPVDGLAAQRTIQVGMWVKAGWPLLSVIPLDQMWVNANYKETQLGQMKIGQKVSMTSDFYGLDVVFHGHVVGLPGAAGNAFSLLPPENLSGNWIKIVQRLPVRVDLDPDELKTHPLRIGLSMEATVDLLDQNGPVVPNSSEGSPTYYTPIFEREEQGDRELIDAIINENLDPQLEQYAEDPISLNEIDFTSEIKKYFRQMNIPSEEFLY